MKQLILLLVAGALIVAGCAGESTQHASVTPTPEPSPTQSATPSPTPTPAPVGCVPVLAAGDHLVGCDGIEYSVRVPPACPAEGCGLILDVHGLSMSADMEDANTGMRERGEANGFVVVQPTSPTASWSESDDPKIHAFVLDASAALGVDADRVHVTGFSQGGRVTLAMVCGWPETWASAAPAAPAGNMCFGLGGTPPATAVPMLHIHGTNDTLVSITSGRAARDAVIAAYGLGSGTIVSGSGFTRTGYTNASGMVLQFLEHDYAADNFLINGHCFAGSTDSGELPGQLFSFACEGPNAFTHGEEVIEFFLAHPRAR